MVVIKSLYAKYKFILLGLLSLVAVIWFNLTYKRKDEAKGDSAKPVLGATENELKEASEIISEAFGTHPDNSSWTEDEEVAYIYINKYIDYKNEISVHYEKLTGRNYFPDVINFLNTKMVKKLTSLNYF